MVETFLESQLATEFLASKIAKIIYSQPLDLQRGANERGEGVYTRYMTEAERDCSFVIGLKGDIGCGKTTLVRALLRALNVQGNIKSPTFSIVETYVLPSSDIDFHHFDLYRIDSYQEESLALIGFSDYFTYKSICCIEWPERSKEAMGMVDLLLEFYWLPDGRKVVFTPYSAKAEVLLAKLEI